MLIYKNLSLKLFIIFWLFDEQHTKKALRNPLLRFLPKKEPPKAVNWAKFFVFIVVKGEFTCTGAVVSSEKIVTSAHCLENTVSPADVAIFFGCITRSECERSQNIIWAKTFATHQKYDGSINDYDVATINLQTAIPLEENKTEIIDLNQSVPPVESKCEIVFFFKDPYPEDVTFVQVEIMWMLDCENRTNITWQECIFCVTDGTNGQSDRHSCAVGSGSLLVCEQRLTGLSVEVDFCSHDIVVASVFTDVTCYGIWITDYKMTNFAYTKNLNLIYNLFTLITLLC